MCHGCLLYLHRYLKQRKETDPIFVSFTQQRRGAERHTLESLLQLPISRIWEYDKLVQQLMAVTPVVHPDYPNLKEASLKLRAVSLLQNVLCVCALCVRLCLTVPCVMLFLRWFNAVRMLSSLLRMRYVSTEFLMNTVHSIFLPLCC